MSAADDAIVTAARARPGPFDVVGEGALAARLRAQLGVARTDGRSRPQTVVETTGTTAGLAAALTLVGDLGSVLLAGPPATEPMSVDLYADLHVRGLTIVGLPGLRAE